MNTYIDKGTLQKDRFAPFEYKINATIELFRRMNGKDISDRLYEISRRVEKQVVLTLDS